MNGSFANPGGPYQLFMVEATVVNSSSAYSGKKASIVFCTDRIELYVWNGDGSTAYSTTLCVAS